MLKEPLVSIIILNWNGYEITRECLLSLGKISFTNYKIILVDNGSADGSNRKLSEEFLDPRIEYLPLERNFGFTGGNNKGIDYTIEKHDPDFILLLNNDTIVETRFLDHMIAAYSTDATCYAVVPKIYYYDNPKIIWFAGGSVSRILGTIIHNGVGKEDDHSDEAGPTGFMNGCCALISRSAINNIGILDNQFFANSEDVDYSLRILDSGHTIQYAPEAIIYHKTSYSFKANKGQWLGYYLGSRAIVLLQRKHLKGWRLLLFYFLYSFRWLLYLTLKFMIRMDFKAIKSIYIGTIDGMTNKLRYVG
jgi:GT2 family glycosyltransferase